MTRHILVLILVSLFSSIGRSQTSDVWNYKKDVLPVLMQAVPKILATENKSSGKFGSGIWISSDQAVILPLAAAWAFKDEKNRYYHDRKLLETIMRCGDALAESQDKDGRWMFRKKDNSTWGMFYNPWVYSRWVRAFSLIRDEMPADRRARWQKALELGFTGIAKTELSGLHNISAHQAMGLYFAGKALDRPQWCEKASAFLGQVASAQDKNGFWSEHVGPVVNYNFVFVDALGIYYAVSRDQKVLSALERAARFHANFTYPDGSNIETIDERNPYSNKLRLPNVGFTFSPTGCGYLRQQWERLTEAAAVESVDVIASLLLYGDEGETATAPGKSGDSIFVMDEGKASVIRNGAWCASFSAYVCPVVKNRWIEDRQNFISLFHESTGLILGGGNTKLQPLWSTFTLGDTTLLKHRPGNENPDFSQPPGLHHVPAKADLNENGRLLSLRYREIWCNVALELFENRACLSYEAASASKTNLVEAHVPFLPAIGAPWRTEKGRTGKLGAAAFTLSADEAGAWFEHNGWRVELPKNSRLTWPVLPHNPYRKDGRAEVEEGRIVLTLQFDGTVPKQNVVVTVSQPQTVPGKRARRN